MVQITAAVLTDVGRVRDVNEDTAWAQIYTNANKKTTGLFVVCDGMGGHMGGEFASYWAVETIKRELADLFISKDPRATVVLSDADIKAVKQGLYVPKPEPEIEVDLEARLKAALHRANHVVYEYARHKPKEAADAGSTVTAALMVDDRVVFANVGDSRAYLGRNHELIQITRDHSLVASLVWSGQILPDEVYTHPQRNVIYRFLGQKGLVPPDIFHEQLIPGDYLLLCSDGLWEMLPSEAQVLKMIEDAADPLEACKEMIYAANCAGGEDNISAIVVSVA
jgi:protein phosphatase